MKGKKTGGRMPGVPNRTTYELKLSLQKLINENLDQMGIDIKELPAKDRLNILLKVCDFIIPKVQTTQPDDSESVYKQNKIMQEYLEKNN